MTEKIPTPILESIRATVGSAIFYIKYNRAESPIHNRLREASKTLGDLISLQKNDEEQPFWYSIYEGLVERYVQLRTEYKKLKEQNKKLKEDYEDLKERYWNAMSSIEEQIEEPERL
jgi:predicted nuclease with TOPRIM domain